MAAIPPRKRKRRSKVESQKVKAEIEVEKQELERLMNSGAGFKEIYEKSVRLDKLIVAYYKRNFG